MSFNLGYNPLLTKLSKLFISLNQVSGPEFNSCQKQMTTEPQNVLYDIWLATRFLRRNNSSHYSNPGSNRPLTIQNIQAAFKIVTLCACDLITRLFALQPTRTIFLILFELLRGLFPALRGYSQALLLNEVRHILGKLR